MPQEKNDIKPERYVLGQNYPNPLNPKTTISFQVKELSRVTVIVYNILGEKIEELTDLPYNHGRYQVTFDASDLSSGIYFYEMRADAIKSASSFRQVKKKTRQNDK